MVPFVVCSNFNRNHRAGREGFPFVSVCEWNVMVGGLKTYIELRCNPNAHFWVVPADEKHHELFVFNEPIQPRLALLGLGCWRGIGDGGFHGVRASP